MSTYTTSQVARIIGIHPNTVRLYEELEFISKPARQPNGYRIFTKLHIDQFKLARVALKIEVLQNGLRKKVIEIIKTSADRKFDDAIRLTYEYEQQVQNEKSRAEGAIESVKQLLSGDEVINTLLLRRNEVAEHLQISMDTLRNWEMNGLLTVNRKSNGHRVYTADDIRILTIIRSLRCANYSLESILRMLNAISQNPQINIKTVLDTPLESDDIISVCDKLITSLEGCQSNAKIMREMIKSMKQCHQRD